MYWSVGWFTPEVMNPPAVSGIWTRTSAGGNGVGSTASSATAEGTSTVMAVSVTEIGVAVGGRVAKPVKAHSTRVAPVNPNVPGRDLAAEGMFAYGSRVGVWRILRLFAERNLPLTVFGCALALERNPQVAAAIRAAGHDVCCHGWRWVKHYELSEADERAQIALH